MMQYCLHYARQINQIVSYIVVKFIRAYYISLAQASNLLIHFRTTRTECNLE